MPLRRRHLNDIERLTFLDSVLKWRGMALGDDGYPDSGLGLLSMERFDELEKERRALLRKLAGEPHDG